MFEISPQGQQESRFLFMSLSGNLRPATRQEAYIAARRRDRLMAFVQTRKDSGGNTIDNSFAVSMRMFAAGAKAQLANNRADAEAAMGGERHDGFEATLGMHDPQDLVQKMKETLKEPMPPLGYETLPMNTLLRPGAQFYRMQRTYVVGEAHGYRGGSGHDVQPIELAQAFVYRPIMYIISAFDIDWMSKTSDAFTGVDSQVELQLGAMRVQREKWNRLVFDGDDDFDVYGLLNHPYVDTYVSDVDFGVAGGATAEQMYTELVNAANYAAEASKGAFKPDTLYISALVHNRAVSKKFGGGDGERVLEAFQKACPHIKNIVPVYEFDRAGPAGTSVLFFARVGVGRADRSIEVMNVMDPTLLPPDRTALNTRTYIMSACAGARQKHVGHNLRVYIPVTDN